jgi:hypothetical protein
MSYSSNADPHFDAIQHILLDADEERAALLEANATLAADVNALRADLEDCQGALQDCLDSEPPVAFTGHIPVAQPLPVPPGTAHTGLLDFGLLIDNVPTGGTQAVTETKLPGTARIDSGSPPWVPLESRHGEITVKRAALGGDGLLLQGDIAHRDRTNIRWLLEVQAGASVLLISFTNTAIAPVGWSEAILSWMPSGTKVGPVELIPARWNSSQKTAFAFTLQLPAGRHELAAAPSLLGMTAFFVGGDFAPLRHDSALHTTLGSKVEYDGKLHSAYHPIIEVRSGRLMEDHEHGFTAHRDGAFWRAAGGLEDKGGFKVLEYDVPGGWTVVQTIHFQTVFRGLDDLLEPVSITHAIYDTDGVFAGLIPLRIPRALRAAYGGNQLRDITWGSSTPGEVTARGLGVIHNVTVDLLNGQVVLPHTARPGYETMQFYLAAPGMDGRIVVATDNPGTRLPYRSETAGGYPIPEGLVPNTTDQQPHGDRRWVVVPDYPTQALTIRADLAPEVSELVGDFLVWRMSADGTTTGHLDSGLPVLASLRRDVALHIPGGQKWQRTGAQTKYTQLQGTGSYVGRIPLDYNQPMSRN